MLLRFVIALFFASFLASHSQAQFISQITSFEAKDSNFGAYDLAWYEAEGNAIVSLVHVDVIPPGYVGAGIDVTVSNGMWKIDRNSFPPMYHLHAPGRHTIRLFEPAVIFIQQGPGVFGVSQYWKLVDTTWDDVP